MRKIIFSALAAASVFAAAAPAAAQPGPHFGNGHQVRQDINQLDFRINRAVQRGAISQREAFGLRRDVQSLRQDLFRFSRNGLDRGEVRLLSTRVDRIQFRLRAERRDRDGRRG